MRVAREVLYKEIWAEPMTTVAARYGLSSNFLARVCERLKIPRPARGYWAQIKVGGKLPKPALPAPSSLIASRRRLDGVEHLGRDVELG